jgi:ABC-type spermidine/putrescine transport system permease subunit I
VSHEIVPPEPHHRLTSGKPFAALISAPVVLAAATVVLLCVWVVLTLSLVLALLVCAALVAIGLPICFFLARRSWRRRFPPSQP